MNFDRAIVLNIIVDDLRTFDIKDQFAARYMTLIGAPVSVAAGQLVDHLLDDPVLTGLGSPPRPSSLLKLRMALGALLSDLIRAREAGLDGKHGIAPRHLPVETLGFGRDVFMKVVGGLVGAGLLLLAKGRSHTSVTFTPGIYLRSGGPLTAFRMTAALVAMVSERTPGSWAEHWKRGKAKATRAAPLLILRAKKLDGQKHGAPLSYDADDRRAQFLLASLVETNTYLSDRIEGTAFVGLKRIFNDGNVAGKRWRRGGRYFSLPGGDSYEMTNGPERRSSIRIDGEAVAEVDISACHLTILYGMMRLTFDASGRDPYETDEGIHREATKTWINASIGKGCVGR